MVDAPVIVTEAGDDAPAVGSLFEGRKFFLAARLPTRSRFVADIQANGGRVVKLEDSADFKIADHLRKPTKAGTFSFTLITQAIRDGVFPDPADHALGPTANSSRAVGSAQPGKRTRTAFTAEDDTALWTWVEQEKAQGESYKGNLIYKRLEAVNSRHTWQAWRDHYVKKLADRPPPGVMGGDASPMDSGEEMVTSQAQSTSKRRRIKQPVEEEVDEDDFDSLWAQARDIENMDDTMYEEAWDLWAQVNPNHTAAKWRQIWESDVRPTYRKQKAKAKAKRRHASISGDEDDSAGRKARKRGKSREELPDDADGDANEENAPQTAPAIADEDLEDPDDDLAALETWQGSTKRKSGSNRRFEQPALPTSEAERAVGEQIQAEINGTTPKENGQVSEQVLIPDVNRAADLQIQNEAGGAQFAAPQVSQTAQQDDLHAWYAEKKEELKGNAHLKEQRPDGHALTEANLVSQQAEHAEPLTRAADLPVDDQNKDQSEYVKFLQNVTGQPQEQAMDFDNDLPSVPQPARTSGSTQATPNIPVSSRQEVDKVMKDALEWPSSPKRNGEQMESQEDQFETQLPQTKLPVSNDHLRNLMPDFELSSQSIMSQANDESFPNQREHDAANAFASQGQRMAQPDTFEGLDDMNGTHIDLSIPEPEGDFTFTSSPERRPAANKNVAVDQLAGKPGPSRTEVVDISSDASSSSSLSSQAEAPSTVKARTKTAVETQDILNAETQKPDFFMPLPDDEQDEGEPSQQRSQDEISTQIQAPEFSMPLPPDWDHPVEAEQRKSGQAPAKRPKNKGKQRVVESQTMDVERELESWLGLQQVRGSSEASAIEAMQRSSMRPDLAELVLLAEKGGLGLPSDVPGIWSEREDRVLESGDSGALRRLEAKHGWDECEARMKFLEEWREA